MTELHLADHIIAYCERQGPGLLAEPLNAFSNLAFFVAAWKLWPEGRVSKDAARLGILAALIALVGAGSLAFHTLATRWASILDVAFIGVFNVFYLTIFLRVVPRWSLAPALAAAAGFFVLDRAAAAVIPSDSLNGSLLYLPALAALIALTLVALSLAPEAGRMMVAALGLFMVSLAARTADRSLCDTWPWGTHFAWHVLNAWVLYRLTRALELAMSGSEERRGWKKRWTKAVKRSS